MGHRTFIGFATDNGQYIARFITPLANTTGNLTDILLTIFSKKNSPEKLFSLLMENHRSITFSLDKNKQLDINVKTKELQIREQEVNVFSEGFNITSLHGSLSPSDPQLWVAGSFSHAYKEPHLKNGDIGYIFSYDLERLILINISEKSNQQKKSTTFAKYDLATTKQYPNIYTHTRLMGITDSNYKNLRKEADSYGARLDEAKKRAPKSLALDESMYYSLQKLNR